MAHLVGRGKKQRCQSEKGKFLPMSRCGKAAAKRGKRGKARKAASRPRCKPPVRVKGHTRKCPKR